MSVLEPTVKVITTSKESTGPKKWVLALVGVALSGLLIASLYFILRRKGKELAKLKHDRDLAAAKAESLELAAKTSKNTAIASKLLDNADRLRQEIQGLHEQMDVLESERKETHEKIDALRTWDDLDRYLDSGRPTKP